MVLEVEGGAAILAAVMHPVAGTVEATGAEGEGTLHTRSVSCDPRRCNALPPKTLLFFIYPAPPLLARALQILFGFLTASV